MLENLKKKSLKALKKIAIKHGIPETVVDILQKEEIIDLLNNNVGKPEKAEFFYNKHIQAFLHLNYNELEKKIKAAWEDIKAKNIQNDSIDFPELKIVIDPGTAPNDEIASVLADISKMYRKMGGSGIAFTLDYVTINQEEVI